MGGRLLGHDRSRTVPERAVGARPRLGFAARWLVAYLSRHEVPDGVVLDLACGSGVFAAGIATTGRRVFGIDASRETVALARRAAPGARFEVGSIYRARFPDSAIVAIIGEGLSCVPPSGDLPELSATFARVWKCLHRRGLFVFDVITGPMRKLVPGRNHRTAREWAVLSETHGLGHRSRFERRITTFRETRGRYRRSDEVHVVQVFDRGRVVETLRQAGFAVRSMRAYEQGAQLPGWTVFVARKR